MFEDLLFGSECYDLLASFIVSWKLEIARELHMGDRLKMRVLIALVLVILFTCCARAPIHGPMGAMRKVSAPQMKDDLPLEPLLRAVETEIQVLDASKEQSVFIFGPERYSREEYLTGLRRFLYLGKKSLTKDEFYSFVKAEFDFYEVYGMNSWGEVFITSYYEPILKGSLKATNRFSIPLYQVPADLIRLDLFSFDVKFESERQLRGRVQDKVFLPYFSREEIDEKNALKGRNLELCWVDPLDAFLLHIQGSGTIDLGNGRFMFLNYAEKNGHRYEAIGKYLKDVIPIERLNLHTMEAYLRGLSREELGKVLNLNPSYVFFKASNQRALTSIGVPATDGRTIAVDKRYFPKGGLALLTFDKPKELLSDHSNVKSSEFVSRFVIDQDTGGAIVGPGRVDLFWGRGEDGKLYSGVIKAVGRLLYLAPKRIKS
jgi:membrane-bound lytic murein transglycosylase A